MHAHYARRKNTYRTTAMLACTTLHVDLATTDNCNQPLPQLRLLQLLQHALTLHSDYHQNHVLLQQRPELRTNVTRTATTLRTTHYSNLHPDFYKHFLLTTATPTTTTSCQTTETVNLTTPTPFHPPMPAVPHGLRISGPMVWESGANIPTLASLYSS